MLIIVCESALAQLPQIAPQRRELDRFADDSALICEAGGFLGGGGANKVSLNQSKIGQPTQRQVWLEFVSKVDVNRDRGLDHSELFTLDFLTRKQLLAKLDENLDRKLDQAELEQVLTEDNESPSDYPYTQQRSAEKAPQPEAFRNLRRYGIGLQQPSPPQRRNPFEKAATFGTSPNFRPPRQKSTIGPSRGGGGRCRLSISGQSSDVYWAVRPGR